MTAISRIASAFLFTVVLAATQPATKGEPPAPEQRMLYLVNQERGLAGLTKLEWNESAAQAAREHSRLLAQHQQLSHAFPGEPLLRERLITTSIRFTSAAENIASADNEDEAHLALMYSPGHRDNILSTEYSAVGIGVVKSGGRLYVTEDFVRILPSYTEQQFLSSFVTSFNALRQARKIRAIVIRKDETMHELACSTQGGVSAPAKIGFSGEVVVFTLADPAQVPAELTQRAYSPRLHQMNLGVCFRPDEKYGAGNFWVAAAFPL